jgi:hypothetical protein
MIIKDIHNLSIIELKQLLAQVNHDLKMNKPTIKRVRKAPAAIIESEGVLCNKIAANYTGTKALPVEHNKKLKADIQIQQDILDYLNNGGRIITAKTRNKVKCQTFRNNKYSVFNKGHQASITGKYGFYATSKTVSL